MTAAFKSMDEAVKHAAFVVEQLSQVYSTKQLRAIVLILADAEIGRFVDAAFASWRYEALPEFKDFIDRLDDTADQLEALIEVAANGVEEPHGS